MAGARAGSAPPGPRDLGALGPRRSQSAGGIAPPTPRLRPLFLWVRQNDTSILQVHCEDYDPANRLRLSKTPLGWRVLPRTETFDAISLPRIPPLPFPRRIRTKRRSRPSHRLPRPRAIDRAPPSRLHRPSLPSTELQPDKHFTDCKEKPLEPLDERLADENESSESENKENTWSLPDIETSIPSHTIHVPQRLDRNCKETFINNNNNNLTESDFNPTPLDKLLAVAEIEFNQQQSNESSLDNTLPSEEELNPQFSKFPFLSDECQRELTSFEIDNQDDNAENSNEDFFIEKKESESNKGSEEDTVFQGGMIAVKDLFETITETHYMPMDLVDGHDQDEAINANELLDSLVEKGCEDNHIVGSDFDKIAHIVNEEEQLEGDYEEEDEEDMMMDDAPVSDIINRLEQSLESPSQHSIAAAQGLLHLQNMTADLSQGQFEECEEKVDNLESDITKSAEFISDEPLDDFDTNDVEVDQKNEEDGTLVDAEENTEPLINLEPTLGSEDIEMDILPNDNNADTDDLINNCEAEERESEEYSCGEPSDADTPDVPDTTKEVLSTSIEDNPIDGATINDRMQSEKDSDSNEYDEDLVPTDLSVNLSNKDQPDSNHITNDDLPKDLSCRKRPASPYHSPRRIGTPRPLSRGSDTVQSPQPSGIPAVPSSPELLSSTQSKSNKSIFLESLLSSPSPKMCFSSELTITKHQNEPLNLGKCRKSASPTVSSCSEEIKKPRMLSESEKTYKDIGCDEPPLAKLNKLFSKATDSSCEDKQRNSRHDKIQRYDDLTPMEQLQSLRCSTDFELPDPLLIPKEKFSSILVSPAREIPALLHQRPELRIPEAFAVPSVLQDPDILVVSLSQLETILLKHHAAVEKDKLKETSKPAKSVTPSTPNSTTDNKKARSTPVSTSSENSVRSSGMGADSLAGDIDAATQAALGQMLWLPYLSQFEAAMACSQNADLLKALHSPVQPNFPQQSGYPDMSQMFLAQARFMNPSSFPPLDYNNQLELAMWQDAMAHSNGSGAQTKSHKSSSHSAENTFYKNTQAQNFLAQAAKMQQYQQQQQNRGHSARTSPVTRGYRNGSTSSLGSSIGSMPSPGVAPLPSFPWMAYPTRPHLPPLGPPQYSPGARSRHQQQPPSPSSYYQNNNYLGLSKHGSRERTGSNKESMGDPQQQPKPRISVKSLQNLLEPAGDVVSSTHPPEDVPINHEQHTPLWHPLFGNQKPYNSPWNWTTVTVNGD